jgi:hypothetical protein
MIVNAREELHCLSNAVFGCSISSFFVFFLLDSIGLGSYHFYQLFRRKNIFFGKEENKCHRRNS